MLNAVLIILFLLVALLAVPVVLTFRITWPQEEERELELQWAFGLVRVQIPVSAPTATSSELEEVADQIEQAEEKPESKKKKRQNNFFAVIRQKPFRQRIFRYIRDLWHAIQKRGMSLRLRIGLDDPADTGQLWALMGPVAGILASSREVSFVIEPEFQEETFEFDSSGSIKFVPMQILVLTLTMLCSPAVWRGLKQLR